MGYDMGVCLSLTGDGSGTYTDRNGQTRNNGTLVNGSWVGMNTATVPTAIVQAGAAGDLCAIVYFNKAGAGVTSVDVRLRAKYAGADADVSGDYIVLPTLSYAEQSTPGTPAALTHNLAATGRDVLATTDQALLGAAIVEVKANGAPVAADAVKVAIVAGGSL